MSLDENLTNKQPGDLIRSKEWNILASETVRLVDAAKLNSQLIGIQMQRGLEWENERTSGDWHMVAKETVNVETDTSFLLVGQGHGLSNASNVSLDVAIRVNGKILGHEATNDLFWGMGLVSPTVSGNTSIWTQIVAIAECSIPSGESGVELVMRCRKPNGGGGAVKFNAPTLWLIRLGAS
ncbi:hypothetical protein [Streptomyces capitiformicae]|uniref:Uncharacterized protein n=1 Tax=Streptomyces capitiformicae TaxID=2014920 RepID=A0A919GIH8_9ACTN|nr:hypothetical protein [Streptomyces capitiformicae]GHH85430.1 hypothetical protein GCM10017771_18260 [Streptomyces capitiformicae]